MATVKSYTDLEQSKKLVEILPAESADMIIVSIGDREGVVTTTMPKETFYMLRTPFIDVRNTISCWSLAALLDYLKQPLERLELAVRVDKNYNVFALIDNLRINLTDEKNLVDTCYKTILELHEQKLL